MSLNARVSGEPACFRCQQLGNVGFCPAIDIGVEHASSFIDHLSVADTGSGTTRAFLTIGQSINGAPWPLRTDCPFWSSAELWFALPGTMNQAGDYDGTLANLPLLPPGFRLWCQAGSIDLANVDMAFSDALTLITPPFGSLPIPTARVASASSRTSPTGSFSYAVPVMEFF